MESFRPYISLHHFHWLASPSPQNSSPVVVGPRLLAPEWTMWNHPLRGHSPPGYPGYQFNQGLGRNKYSASGEMLGRELWKWCNTSTHHKFHKEFHTLLSSWCSFHYYLHSNTVVITRYHDRSSKGQGHKWPKKDSKQYEQYPAYDVCPSWNSWHHPVTSNTDTPTLPAHVRANCPPNVYAADPTGKWWSKLLHKCRLWHQNNHPKSPNHFCSTPPTTVTKNILAWQVELTSKRGHLGYCLWQSFRDISRMPTALLINVLNHLSPAPLQVPSGDKVNGHKFHGEHW